MKKVLDNTNLGYFYSKLKSIFWKKTDVDSTPAYDSTNLVTSGGVQRAIDDHPIYVDWGEVTTDDITVSVTTTNVSKFTIASGLRVGIELDNSLSTSLEYFHWIFDTGATAPTITWPSAIKEWAGGSAPTIAANKRYEVSLLKGVAVVLETDIPSTT